MVAPQDNTGPGSGGSPPVCICGRGPTWWTVVNPPICLLCVPALYGLYGTHIPPDSGHWQQISDLIERLMERLDGSTLIAVLDQLEMTYAGR